MNNEAAQAKLADIERQVKELKEQLAAPGHWAPGLSERYLCVDHLGQVFEAINTDADYDKVFIKNGNAYPATPEGRAAAEHAAFLIGFRARWRRSADVAQNEPGYLPTFGEGRILRIYFAQLGYGLLKWSTPQKCRAFVDSEGGPERFAEILERGIL